MALTAIQVATEVRALINEATAAFWTDPEITNWVSRGAIDVSGKAGCVETTATVTLAASTIQYAKPTTFTNPTPASSTASLTKVHAALFNNIALIKAHPRMFGHANSDTTGDTPLFYAHFGTQVFFFPVGANASGTVTLLCSVETDDVVDLPDEWQIPVIMYAAYLAKMKDQKFAEAAVFYADYTNSIGYGRNDLLERGVTSRAELVTPDQNVAQG